MLVCGVRGATSVGSNTKEAILDATKELLSKMLSENNFMVDEIASIIFSATKDLNAEFPAVAARELGWNDTPLLCTNEIDVPGSLPRCIRVLLHVNTDKNPREIKHIYLKDAQKLRR